MMAVISVSTGTLIDVCKECQNLSEYNYTEYNNYYKQVYTFDFSSTLTCVSIAGQVVSWIAAACVGACSVVASVLAVVSHRTEALIDI